MSRSRGSARFHLKARLIDARTDALVWEEEYDRDLNDVFAVQTELARKVAQRLRAKISNAIKPVSNLKMSAGTIGKPAMPKGSGNCVRAGRKKRDCW